MVEQTIGIIYGLFVNIITANIRLRSVAVLVILGVRGLKMLIPFKFLTVRAVRKMYVRVWKVG